MDTGKSGIDATLALEALSFGAYLFDRQCRLVFVNREAMRMFGFRSFAEAADELEGRTQALRVAGIGGAPAHPAPYWIRRSLAGEPVTEDLVRVHPLDGKPQMIVRASFAPVRSAEGEIIGVVKTVRDVTLEYELERRKNEFVRLTMHELRTPATTLRLRAQRLLCSPPLPAEQLHEAAEAIDRATRRIETLSVKLQDIAILAAGEPLPLQPTRVRLDTLIADVVQSLEPEQARRIHTTTSPAEVRADAFRVREVVEALLDNALRYSQGSAEVDVDVETHDGEVELSVADQGIGIPRGEQEHLFEQFYRAHAGTPFDRGGLGASLYLADHIVRQHGGRMWFESAERRGSTFHVALRAIFQS